MKLLKVSASNYKMCENDITFSFVPSGNKSQEDKEYELNLIDEDLYTFNTISIIGKNASGKTTIVNLLWIVYNLTHSFRLHNFRQVTTNFKNNLKLDITFYNDGNLYRYITFIELKSDGLAKKFIFKDEELYTKKYNPTTSRYLFDYSKYKKCEIIDKPIDVSALYQVLKDSKDNSGMCFFAYDPDSQIFNEIIDLYNSFDATGDIFIKTIKMFDNHIDKLEKVNKDLYKISIKKEVREVTSLELLSILSSGTIKGIVLYAFVIYALKNGCDFIVDEIETHFHRRLVENLIVLFKDKLVNKKGSTLIFTTHYPELLDTFTRTDNILIVKYDENIQLKSMHDYDIRNDLLKSKKYYNNAFGTDIDYEALMDLKRELMK